jgi:hypothetical protein
MIEENNLPNQWIAEKLLHATFGQRTSASGKYNGDHRLLLPVKKHMSGHGVSRSQSPGKSAENGMVLLSSVSGNGFHYIRHPLFVNGSDTVLTVRFMFSLSLLTSPQTFSYTSNRYETPLIDSKGGIPWQRSTPFSS